ncbi:hypothetical protein CP02DC21_1231, partial [Chlamydia psittaci 02DC21]
MSQTGFKLERNRPAQTGLNPDFTTSIRTQIRADRLKQVLTILDRLKPVLTGSNRTRSAETGFDWVKS